MHGDDDSMGSVTMIHVSLSWRKAMINFVNYKGDNDIIEGDLDTTYTQAV